MRRGIGHISLIATALALYGTTGCAFSDVRITLRAEQEPGLTDEARAVVLLWGHHRYVADAGSTLIARFDERVAAMPTHVGADIPTSAHTLIDHGAGPVSEQEAGFYFTFFVDVDGDDKICKGDLVEDFGIGGGAFYTDHIPARIETPMVAKTGNDCANLAEFHLRVR